MSREQAEKLKALIIARLRLVIDPETRADVVRMRALAMGQNATRATETMPAHPVRVRLAWRNVAVEYCNGWVEEVKGNRFRIVGGFGGEIVDRAATNADRNRLRAVSGR